MKRYKSRNVLVVVGTNVPGKLGLCQLLWRLWEIPAATSPEGQRPVSLWGRIKGPQNARGAQGQEELL